MNRPMKQLARYPAFDGFRGIGMSAVLLSHLPLASDSTLYNIFWTANQDIKLGYIALDTFFLISGFFITRLLVRERLKTGTISLSDFYLRRSLRIFPIYYLTAIACAFIFHLGFPETVSILTYTFNFYHPFVPTPNPLEHTWSLSVEEQFYLVWPLLIMVIPLRHARRITGMLIPGLAVLAGIGMSLWAGGRDQMLSGNLVYMSLFTRMMSLSFGAWLAFREGEDDRIGGQVGLGLLVSGLLLLALDRLGRSAGVVGWQGLYWTIALCGYAMLSVAFSATIIFGRGLVHDVIVRALSLGPLRFLGQLSYAYYLFHLPVLYYLGLNEAALGVGGTAPLSRLLFASLLVFGLAVVSQYAIELPLMSLRHRIGGPRAGTAKAAPSR